MTKVRSFLAPLIANRALECRLVNAATGVVLATRLEPAFDSATRRKGLLGRDGLDPDAAILIAPCNSVHTFFMRFTIDVVFAARDGRVLKICRGMKPSRIAASFGAHTAIEFDSRAGLTDGLNPGDRLAIESTPAFSGRQ
jgi:uncharacterized membrane protein (UPF0127 family)